MKVKIIKFLKNKIVIWMAVILLIIIGIGYFVFGKKNNAGSIQTAVVSKQNLEQTVLTTGQVVSGTDLDLSFQVSGILRRVLAKEGDKVKAGQVLATLEQASAQATLTSAQGTMAQAVANYKKLLDGITFEELKTFEDAKNTAQQNLDNAYGDVFTTIQDAHIKVYNAYNSVVSIQNNNFLSNDQESFTVRENKEKINRNAESIKSYLNTNKNNFQSDTADEALSSVLTSLTEVSNALGIIREICDDGTYYSKVSSTDKTSLDNQRGYINTTLTNIVTSKQTIASDKIALQTAADQLVFKGISATQANIDVAKAQILSAEGQVSSAQASLNNLILTAPLSGTITEVNAKVGELISPTAKSMVLQNISDIHAEANVSEANIASLSLGQTIDYTFDAFGPDKHFTGKILTINPASIVVSGVVNYKVTGSLENVSEVKPGMTVNMTILVVQKNGVLAVPSTAISNKNGKKYVKIITDSKKKTFNEIEVQTGLQADGGLVEIVLGLKEGQEIITYIKQ